MNNTSNLTVLQMNDTHGYLDLHLEWMAGPHQPVYRSVGGFARIGALARQIREETQGQVLFCDNGDTFHGTQPVVQRRGEIAVPILNQLGLNAMTVHWDFAYGPKRLKSLASRLKYPVLAINIYDPKTGQTFFPPYAVQEVGGLKIGIIRNRLEYPGQDHAPFLQWRAALHRRPRGIDRLHRGGTCARGRLGGTIVVH